MNKYEELANEIIDLIIETILEENPEIDITKKQGNTLLYGEAYFNLEDHIANRIQDLKCRSLSEINDQEQ